MKSHQTIMKSHQESGKVRQSDTKNIVQEKTAKNETTKNQLTRN
jgi:hypothetical protein